MGCDGAVTTPLTEMLAVYRACPRGLTEGEAYGKRLLAEPDHLASLFLLTVAQFSRYVNISEAFHDGPAAPPFTPHHGVNVASTVDVAKRIFDAGGGVVEGDDGFEFVYVDRELDVMRSSSGQPFDDGTPSKRALVLDLLLARLDGTPIATEVKIGKDTHAVYALVQALAAAAHLVTPAQRVRLEEIYANAVMIPKRAPYVEVAILLVGLPRTGKAVEVLGVAQEVARSLLSAPAFNTIVGAIHFLVPVDLGERPIVFRRI
jgi:hypothetical protein